MGRYYLPWNNWLLLAVALAVGLLVWLFRC